MRRIVILLTALAAAPAFGETTPSIGEDFKNAGRSVEQGVKGTYDKAEDATVHGVGKVLQKTGEGLDKAGKSVEGAGKAAEEKVE